MGRESLRLVPLPLDAGAIWDADFTHDTAAAAAVVILWWAVLRSVAWTSWRGVLARVHGVKTVCLLWSEGGAPQASGHDHVSPAV